MESGERSLRSINGERTGEKSLKKKGGRKSGRGDKTVKRKTRETR